MIGVVESKNRTCCRGPVPESATMSGAVVGSPRAVGWNRPGNLPVCRRIGCPWGEVIFVVVGSDVLTASFQVVPALSLTFRLLACSSSLPMTSPSL